MPTNYQIPFATALQWVTNWKDEHPSLVKSFRIDLEELQQVMEVPGATYVRAHLGLDKSENPPAYKLMLVAVDGHGNDIVNTDAGHPSNVFDINSPCPSYCDFESPLNLS